MSRVKKPNKFMNTPKYDSSVTNPTKITRIHVNGEDYHKATSLSQWLFIKYDLTYKKYRSKSKKQRHKLLEEFQLDTGIISNKKNAKEIKKTKKIKEIDIDECSREGFKGCYYDASGYGYFKGQVIKIIEKGSNIRYLFKRIYVEWESGVNILEDKEDHVWIFNAIPFKDKEIKIADYVSFSAEVYPYKRKNGTCDLGIKNPYNIEKIESYKLPSDEKITIQFLKQLRCETCLFSERCEGIYCLRE